MKSNIEFRLRKAIAINRENATFELLLDDVAILDVGFSYDGVFEVAFDERIGGGVFEWAQLQEWIERGKNLAELDMM